MSPLRGEHADVLLRIDFVISFNFLFWAGNLFMIHAIFFLNNLKYHTLDLNRSDNAVYVKSTGSLNLIVSYQ